MIVDRIPVSCDRCFANDDGYRCGVSGENIIGITEKRADCPLIELVRCQDCKWSIGSEHNVRCEKFYGMGGYDEFCSYGERK